MELQDEKTGQMSAECHDSVVEMRRSQTEKGESSLEGKESKQTKSCCPKS